MYLLNSCYHIIINVCIPYKPMNNCVADKCVIATVIIKIISSQK